jgi:plastocyanin
MLGVSGRETTILDKAKQVALAGMLSLGLFAGAANADATVKMGSDSGQLVFVPDEVTIKAGESVTWVGNVGMPHNVVFDEENIPDGTDAEKLSHEDQVNEEGGKYSTKFEKPGSYQYYCEPHRGAGMNAVVVVK